MDAFTEESLNKLPKQELIAIYLKVAKKNGITERSNIGRSPVH